MERPKLRTLLLMLAVVVPVAVLVLFGLREIAQTSKAIAPSPQIDQQLVGSGPTLAPGDSGKTASATSVCASTGPQDVRITPESIGPIALDSSIRVLRRQFPDARDRKFYVEENSLDGVAFGIGGLTAMAAINYSDSFPAEFWVVHGVGGSFACGVSMNATWGELRRQYGKPSVRGGETGVYADFPGLKGLSLGLDLSEHLERLMYDQPDADSIPDSARVVDRVHIPHGGR